MKVSILGTGRAIPADSVHSEDIDRALGSGQRVTATGVMRRFRVAGETQIDLAVAAGLAALADAGINPHDIDLVLSAAAVPYQPIPATAPLVMRGLGMRDGSAAAFDVNSTCLSFVSALEIAARMISGGATRRALVVASELPSRALPWDTDPEVAALFGDGAAAAVIGPTPAGAAGEIRAIGLRSYPSAYEACQIGAGGTRFDFRKDSADFAAHTLFEMDGKALFRITARHFGEFVDGLLQQAGWSHDDVDLVVPHQASPAALDHMIRQSGFHADQIVRIVADYGNQVAASIPFALDVARKDGRAATGRKILLLGTSAGVSFGGAALVI